MVPETRPKRPPKFGPCWFYDSSKQSKTCVSFRRFKDLSLLSQPLLEKLVTFHLARVPPKIDRVENKSNREESASGTTRSDRTIDRNCSNILVTLSSQTLQSESEKR